MELLCLGVSHKTAPLSVRERLAMAPEAQAELVREVGAAPLEAMVLCTCNRAELYLWTSDHDAARVAAEGALLRVGGPELAGHLYEHCKDAAVTHLFRVAASLDSMVVGEPQILGQVKDAFERAKAAGGARAELSRVFAAAFGCAKRVRTETAIGQAAVSMASAAVELAQKIFGGLEGKAILLVGAGEMAEVAGRHLRAAGAGKIAIANRTVVRAEELAGQLGGEAAPMEALGRLLVEADVVVCSTASLQPLITRALLAPLLKARRYRPLFLVDLAVPRDVAPDVHELEAVYAYDVDDIQKVVAQNAAVRAAEAARAEGVVAQEVSRYLRDRATREQLPVLAQLRARAEQIARAEVARTLERLGPSLDPKQQQSVEAMAMAIINKLLHQPTLRLRAQGGQPDVERLADAAATLFGLEEDGPKAASGGER
jgi:glutamyl-tRNA reductase